MGNKAVPGQMGAGRIVLRMIAEHESVLLDCLGADTGCEQMAFAAVRPVLVGADTILLLNGLYIPDEEDYAQHSVACVEPTSEFKRMVYTDCKESGIVPVDIHTHPHKGRPRFSGTDDRYGIADAEYVDENFEGPAGLTMLVFGNDLGGFDGRVWDPSLDRYRPIDEIQVLGRGGRIIRAEDDGVPVYEEERLDRQIRVPGHRLDYLARQDVVIAGLGGNGAQLLDEAAGIGLGADASYTLIDDDLIDATNLSRIPYAYEADIGRPKAEVAAEHLRRRIPEIDVRVLTCSVHDPQCRMALANATVTFGCGDNDGMRSTLSAWSARYLSVYIDLGCDIQGIKEEGEKQLVAGGQIRVVLPGSNACLVCCRGYDPVAAAMDQMTEEEHDARAAVGYVRGMDDEPTPSVSTLNALTASYAITSFLALGHPDQFEAWDYLRFDFLTGQTITATSERRADCPLCGVHGQLGTGNHVLHVGSEDQETDSPNQSIDEVDGDDDEPILENIGDGSEEDHIAEGEVVLVDESSS